MICPTPATHTHKSLRPRLTSTTCTTRCRATAGPSCTTRMCVLSRPMFTFTLAATAPADNHTTHPATPRSTAPSGPRPPPPTASTYKRSCSSRTARRRARNRHPAGGVATLRNPSLNPPHHDLHGCMPRCPEANTRHARLGILSTRRARHSRGAGSLVVRDGLLGMRGRDV